MPLCFWAAQTALAASDLCVEAGRPTFTPYLPPHTAATAIQHTYHSYASHVHNEWEWQQKLSWAGYELKCNVNLAMRNLWDSVTFVFSVGDYSWMPCWDDG
jgi:hypothetical protein